MADIDERDLANQIAAVSAQAQRILFKLQQLQTRSSG
jgi:hypothetical protein